MEVFGINGLKKGKSLHSLFKMAIGVIIMAFGFFFMSKASYRSCNGW